MRKIAAGVALLMRHGLNYVQTARPSVANEIRAAYGQQRRGSTVGASRQHIQAVHTAAER